MSLDTVAAIDEALRSEKIRVRVLHQIWEQRRAIPALKGKSPGASTTQVHWLKEDGELALLFAERALRAEEYRLICDLGEEVDRLPIPMDDDIAYTRLQ